MTTTLRAPFVAAIIAVLFISSSLMARGHSLASIHSTPQPNKLSVAKAAASASGTLTIHDLGEQAYNSEWTGVNDDGVVFGWAFGSKGYSDLHARTWTNGVTKKFGTAAGAANGIDDDGNVFGLHFNGDTGDHKYPARWPAKGGEIIDKSIPPTETDGVAFGGYLHATANGTVIGLDQGGCNCNFIAQPPSYKIHSVTAIQALQVNNLAHTIGLTHPTPETSEGALYDGKKVTDVGMDYPTALNNHDDVVGDTMTSNARVPQEWHNGHTKPLPLPSEDTSAFPQSVNDSNVVVGYSSTAGAVVWKSGAVKSLDSLLPKKSPWHLTQAMAITNSGYILGIGTLNSATHYFLTQISAGLSGHVYGVQCTDTSCKQSGMPNVTILITGKTTTGNKIDKTVETSSDGSWSADVQNGKYNAGPTNDGTTFIGNAFDPARVPITFTGSATPDLNFKSCIDNQNGASSAASLRGDALAKNTEFCTSIYNVKIAAKIPSAVLVDPSKFARYNQNDNPDKPDYRSDTGWINRFSQTAPIRKLLGKSRQYPECLPEHLEKKFSKNGTKVDWYSYILTGGYKNPLGTATVPIAWNQDTGIAKVLAQGPTVVKGALTKVFKYKYVDPDSGMRVQSKCTQDETPRPVQMLVWPVAGGNGVEPGMPDSEFSIFVAWGFPFTSTGVRMEEETTLVGTTLKKFGELGHKLYDLYEKAPLALKFVIDFLLGAVLGELWVKVVEGAAARLIHLAHGLEYLEKYGGITAKLFHGVKAVQEIAGFASSYSGEYPVMDAVVRGQFKTDTIRTVDLATGKVSNTKVCKKSALAVSVKTTEFPTIAMQVSRSAEPTNVAGTVYEGPLPWESTPSVLNANPKTTNPFDKNPASLLTNIADNKTNYTSGESAVKAIESKTKDNAKLRESLTETDTLDNDYTEEVNEANFPSCSFEAKPAHESTICWVFNDGKA